MQSISSVLSVVAALVVLIAIGAPAPTDATVSVQDPPLPVRLFDTGFAIGAPLPGSYFAMQPRQVVVIVRLENPNADVAAEGITVTVRLRSGRPVSFFVEQLSVAQLRPGEVRNLIVRLQLPAIGVEEVERGGRVDASVMGPLRWRAVGSVPSIGVQLRSGSRLDSPAAVTGLSSIHDDLVIDGQWVGLTTPVAAATITNPFDIFIAGVDLSAIAFDAHGQVIGGGQRTVALSPHETKPLSVAMIVPRGLNAIARVELTAALPYIDLTPYELR